MNMKKTTTTLPVYVASYNEQEPISIFPTRLPAYQQGPPVQRTEIVTNESYVGETIERRIEKIMNNNEPITDGAPQIYTERADGVAPEYNVRTDRFEIALEMTDQIHKNAMAKRAQRAEERTKANTPEPTPTPNANQTQTQPTPTPPTPTPPTK